MATTKTKVRKMSAVKDEPTLDAKSAEIVLDAFVRSGYSPEGPGEGLEIVRAVTLRDDLSLRVVTLGRSMEFDGYKVLRSGKWETLASLETVEDGAENFSLVRVFAETVLRTAGPNPNRDDIRRGVETLCSLLARTTFASFNFPGDAPKQTATPSPEKRRAARRKRGRK